MWQECTGAINYALAIVAAQLHLLPCIYARPAYTLAPCKTLPMCRLLHASVASPAGAC